MSPISTEREGRRATEERGRIQCQDQTLKTELTNGKVRGTTNDADKHNG